MSLLDIPNDVLSDTLLSLPYYELKNLCSTNKQFARLCNNYHFWNRKALHDYAQPLAPIHHLYAQLARRQNDCVAGPITDDCLIKAINENKVDLLKYYLKSNQYFIPRLIFHPFHDSFDIQIKNRFIDIVINSVIKSKDRELFFLIFNYLSDKSQRFFYDEPPAIIRRLLLSISSQEGFIDLIKLILSLFPNLVHKIYDDIPHIFSQLVEFYPIGTNLSQSDHKFILILLQGYPPFEYTEPNCSIIQDLLRIIDFDTFIHLVKYTLEEDYYDEFIFCATFYLIQTRRNFDRSLIFEILDTMEKSMRKEILKMLRESGDRRYSEILQKYGYNV